MAAPIRFTRFELKPKEHKYSDLSRAMEVRPEMLCLQARLATAMVERWGSVAGEPDGEDTAGRSKLKLAAPDDLVKRACDVSESLVQQLNDRGWIMETPPVEVRFPVEAEVED